MKHLLLCALAVLASSSVASAATVSVSGTSSWKLKATVVEYFWGVAPATGVPDVGATGEKTVTSSYVGEIVLDQYGPGWHDYTYLFDNGWNAFSNSSYTIEVGSACGYIINYCVGGLSGPQWEVVEANTILTYGIVGEGSDPALGDPIGFPSIVETVIIADRLDGGNFHFFTAYGVSENAGALTPIPLPATAALLGSGIALLAAVRRRARAA